MARRWTLAGMRRANKAAGQYFFQKGNADFFGDKELKALYDGETNYIRVTNKQGRKIWYKFNSKTGDLLWVDANTIPKHLKEQP